MKLSVVVPCYNEEENIHLIYETILHDFSHCDFDYEIVFVNDGSKDNTYTELKKLLAFEQPIKIVNFSRNFGKESAMYAGLKESSGDYVAIIDADLQQRPALVLDMVRMLDDEPEYDCVAAYQENRSEGKFISFCKDIFYKFINRFSDTEFVKGASDFRVFSRKMAQSVIDADEYFRFSKGLFSWVGYNTKFIPYIADERANGTSKWSFPKLVAYALDGIFAFTTAPLKIPTFIGLLSVLVSVIYLIAVIIHNSVSSFYVVTYQPVLFAVLFIGGLQLTAMGIAGEYLARTYIQTKNRPIYIAKEVVTNKKEGNNING
ncbi:MAG: glycosyltransferase family 2 protein [Clostridia bacterium]|nr:glycosyltransferase family 2 protein [Clostridia bacterium]